MKGPKVKLKSRTCRVVLRESARLAGRVDRGRGIIFSVKVCGLSSPNTHGVRGVDGTEYTLEALRKAAHLYEGINCNVDHPARNRPDAERSAHDRFAWLEGVHVTESGLFGDLHFLDALDPLAVKMMNAAESKPDAYALSHNAVGKGEVQGDKYVIVEIPEVRSVDIVADGGSNRSLFEGRTVKKRVHTVLSEKVLSALRGGRKKRLERLLRTSLSEARSPLMEAEDEDTDHRNHLYKAMRASEDAGNEDAAKGIHKLLDPSKRNGAAEDEDEEALEEEDEEKDEEEGEEEDTEEGEGVEGPGEPGEHNEGPDGGRGKGAREGRRQRKLRRGEIHLNEARSLAMCKAAGLEATADLMEAMRGAAFEQALAILALAKRTQARPAPSQPRSTAPLRESAGVIPRDLKTWAESLKG